MFEMSRHGLFMIIYLSGIVGFIMFTTFCNSTFLSGRKKLSLLVFAPLALLCLFAAMNAHLLSALH